MRRLIIVLGAVALLLGACAEASPVAEPLEPAVQVTTVPTTVAPPVSSTTSSTMTHDEMDDHAMQDNQTDEADHEEVGDADRIIEVVMTEFAFEPGVFDVVAGEVVTFVIHNEGVIQHEFRITNEHAAEEHLAAGHADHEEAAEAGHHEELLVLVDPGQSAELTVSFDHDASFDVVACLIEGHYEAGMLAALTLGG
ncbi:MAG: hypothetical protein OEO77_05320 [Acidimicrobiia bacterium]|nr:hypothetical protein [Acidimicrobiia bacterium]